jgi:hypothetical protein
MAVDPRIRNVWVARVEFTPKREFRAVFLAPPGRIA